MSGPGATWGFTFQFAWAVASSLAVLEGEGETLVVEGILDGRLDGGERLPSENELAERHATSRPTVRRAIALLKAEGLVSTEQGRGAFVRARPHVRLVLSGANFRRHRRAGLSGFNAQVEEQGQVPEQRLLEVTRVVAPDDIATRLGLEPGSPVVVRRRQFLVNEEPVACATATTREIGRTAPRWRSASALPVALIG
jgi:GntR family transcriptional regulator